MTKLNQEDYRKLISGQEKGLGAAILRFFLGIAAQVYSTAIALRNFLYSKGWLKTYPAEAVVISIGNITTGGTGKTPLVIWLCKRLREKNIDCAILTRGYKAKEDEFSDEPAILRKSCPDTKVVVNPDRVAGAAEAVHPVRNSIGVNGEQCGEVSNGVNKFSAKVLIMDDGFQHRRLGRDLDIVAIDATRPFGYGKMLPAGLLREPITALKRADAVVITRCDQLPEYKLSQLEKRLQSVNPDMMVVRSVHAPVCARVAGNKEIGIEELRGKNIFAFCGIGNPDAFLGTIKKLGLNLVSSKVYNDHYHYTANDFADICQEARHSKANLILSTEKDWTKTAVLASAKKDIPLGYLLTELRFLAEEDKLRGLIEDALADKIL